MTQADSFIRLFKSVELVGKARDWPEKTGIALIKIRGKRLAPQFFNDDEDPASAVKRICAISEALPAEVEVMPHAAGFRRAILSVATDHGLLQEACELARNNERIIDDACDFAVNFDYANDAGHDLLRILKS